MSSVVAKGEEVAYKAAEAVRAEAGVVEGVARRVETLCEAVQAHVDQAETFVHEFDSKVNTTTKTPLDDVGNIMTTTSGSTPSSLEETYATGPNSMKDVLAFGWPWNMFGFLLMLLTIFIVLLHQWDNTISDQNDNGKNGNSTSSNANLVPSISMWLINPGIILRAYRKIRDVINTQKRIGQTIEEDVVSIGEKVKSVAKNVEDVATIVEHVSQQMEQEASQVQHFVEKEGSQG